jgi:hypothetical protein
VYNFARQPSLLPCWRLFLSNALPLSTEPTTPVELSIVVPMYNEAARVEGTLRTILAYLGEQSYGSEVIVVDDGSTDGTASIADDYSKRQAMVRVLRHDPNRDEAVALFRLQKCDGWAFDAEVLYLARLMGLTVLQYPVRWSHCGDSRVRFPHDIIRTLVALISIRWRVSRAMREAPVVAAGMSLTEQRRSPVTPTASETNENAER